MPRRRRLNLLIQKDLVQVSVELYHLEDLDAIQKLPVLVRGVNLVASDMWKWDHR